MQDWVKSLRSSPRDHAKIGRDASTVEDAIRDVYRVNVWVVAGDDRDDVKRRIRRKLAKSAT